MEIIAGSSNWKLVVHRTDAGIVIAEAVTCDKAARLPEELFGQPVIELGDHAMAPRAVKAQGEEVLLTCGPTEGLEWNNRKMQELWLPESLKKIDSYGLYNCTGLHTLHLHDSVEYWGGAALMNCQNIRRLEIDGTGAEGETLYFLAAELPYELDITIRRRGLDTVRLFLPEYFEDYEENGPAHLFNFYIYGEGYPYHHCYKEKKLSLPAYDRLWSELITTAAVGDEAPLNIAWYRLRYPADLSDWAEKGYLAYIREHRMDAGRRLLAKKDIDGLRFLLEKAEWEADELSQLCTEARGKRQSEALAVLLEKQHQRRPTGFDRDFDL